MAVMNTFAKRLKSLREEHKLSQTELANALGISRGSLSFYENAERTADIEMLYKVSEYFGVTLDYLIGKSDNRTKENAVIGEDLGLSDKAIEILRLYNEHFHGAVLIPTINLLIEQEEPSPMALGFSFSILDMLSPEQKKKYEDRQLEKLELCHKEWEKKNLVTVVSSIEKYLTVPTSKELLYITQNGEIKTEKQFKNETTDRVLVGWVPIKQISKSDIINRALLLEVQDKIRQLKEGANNADNPETR